MATIEPMKKEQEQEKSLKTHSLLYSFAIIVILLIIISIINITVRCLFGSEQAEKHIKVQNLIYDPDETTNWTSVCPILKDEHIIGHQQKWKLSPCFNKTLLHLHIPWIRVWIWNKFSMIAEERVRLKMSAEKKKADEATVQAEVKVDGKIEEEDVVEKLTKEVSKEIPVRDKEAIREPTGVVSAALSAMVLLTTLVACVDFFQKKFGKKTAEEERDQEQRRCSLADFTMNKHLRKESHETLQRQGAFDETKKVNNLFIHQGSLDRAMTRLSTPVTRLPRQSSVPNSMTGAGCSSVSMDTKSPLQTLRHPSVDNSEDERSPNLKRRPRHFIRRH